MLIRETENQTADEMRPQLTAEEVPTDSRQATLAPEEVEGLLDQLQKQGRRRSRLTVANSVLGWTIGGNAGVATAMAAYAFLRTAGKARVVVDWTDWSGLVSNHVDASGATVSFGGPWVVACMVMVACWAALRLARRKQARMSKVLPHLNDPRALGPLLEALDLGDPQLRAEAAEAVIPLLEGVRASDADHITAAQRAVLHEQMWEGPEGLLEAGLRALEQIGGKEDADALKEVLSREKDDVRRAALESTIAAIQRKVAAESARDQLLRPAEPVTPDVLLRPAASTTEADPTTLLRPS